MPMSDSIRRDDKDSYRILNSHVGHMFVDASCSQDWNALGEDGFHKTTSDKRLGDV